MPRVLFVDTSGWYAAFNRADPWHQAVQASIKEARATRQALVTTDDVIDETLTLIRMRAGHALAVKFGEAVWRRGGAEVISLDSQARDAAWTLFQRYRDHDLSFTDCTSAAAMRHRMIERVLTLDAHFTVLGFSRTPVQR